MFHKRQQGIGLLELMLALAVIALLLVMATRYYITAHQSQQMNEMIGILQDIRASSADWAAGKHSYAGIDVPGVISYGLIPNEVISGSGATATITTPWQGTTVTVGPTNSDTQVLVTVDALPAFACNNISGKFTLQGSTTCTANPNGTGKLEVTFF